MNAVHYTQDFFGDDFIRDPLPRKADMRALGPVTWLTHHKAYAVIRDAEVRDVFRPFHSLPVRVDAA